MVVQTVGTARVLVRPVVPPSITRDIERNFRSIDRIGLRAGGRLGASFKRGFEIMGKNGTLLGNTARGLRQIGIDGEAASRAFSNISRAGQFIGPILGGLVGAVGALIGGLGALIGSAGGAAASLSSLGAAGFTAIAGLSAVRLALGGVGKALSALNRSGGGGGGGGSSASNTAALAAAREAALKRVQDAEASLALTVERNRESLLDANNAVRDAQLSLNAALKEGREEIQQLGFDAEDAALSEQRAALELEDARRALAAAQDLPPNSRVRREAELAYQEAELNYRKAKDSASDLAAEQERLARTGVAGTDTVIRATEQLAQAEKDREKAVRDALRAQIDAEDDLAEAKKNALTAGQETDTGSSGGGGGGSDPFAGLNAAQIQFVKNLQTLKPELDELKRRTAEALLPNLWEAVKIIMDDTGKVFPVLADGLEGMARAAGLASLSLARAVEESSNLADLQSSFAQAEPLFETFGRVAAEAWGVIITVIERTFPIAQRFFSFLEDKLRGFDEWMDTDQGRSSMEDFLQRSSDAMAQWGAIFGNIFGGFGAVINANLGPGTGGQLLLDWFEESTQKFADLDSTAAKSQGLKDYFLGAAENSKAVMQALGALITEIIKVGDMPQIKETWDILGQGADDLGLMLQEAIKVGPAFAEVARTLAEIGGLLTDAETGIAFFSTINAVLTPIKDFLSGPMVQAFLDFLAPITGIALAIGGLGLVAQAAFTIIAGYVARAISPIVTLFTLFANNPILLAVAALTAAIIYLWNTNEEFRSSLTETFGQLMEIFGTLATELSGVLAEVLPPLMTALQGAFDALMPVISILVTTLADTFVQVLGALTPIIPILVGALVPAITSVVEAVAPLATMLGETLTAIMPTVTELLTALAGVFTTIVSAVAPLIPTLVQSLVPALVSIVQAVMPLIPLLVNSLLPIFTQLAGVFTTIATQVLSTLIPIIVQLVNTFVPLVVTLVEKLVPVIMDIVEAVLPVFTAALETVVPIVLQVIEAFLPFVAMLLENVIPIIARVIETLMPLVTTLAELLAPILEVVIGLFNAIVPPIMELVSRVLSFLLPILIELGNFISGILIGALNFLIDVFKNFVIPVIMNVVNTIADFLLPIISAITDLLGSVIGFLVDVFTGNWASAWDNLVGIVKGVVNVIISVVESMINFVIDGINGFLGALNEAGNFVSDVTGGAIDINVGKIGRVKIPRLAEGGTVQATPGGIMAIIGEAGQNERVEPLDKDGLSKRDYAMIEALTAGYGGGVNIQVVQNPGENMEAFAQRVSEIISQKMRRGQA